MRSIATSFPLEWVLPLNALLIALNAAQCLRFAMGRRGAPMSTGRAEATFATLPLTFRLASILVSFLVVLSASSSKDPISLRGATCIALGLALAAPFLIRLPPARATKWLARTCLAWPVALACHGLAGGAVAVAHLVLSPSPLEGQLVADGLGWGLLDKRWLVACYTLGVSLVVVLPIFLRRVFELVGLQAGSSPGLLAVLPGTHQPRRRLVDVLGFLALAVVFATWFFAKTFSHMPELLDMHELVHLGSLQGIRQGLLPYLEAETQYGPGHQLLTYWTMERIGFSLYGFRISHLLANLVAMALVYFCYLTIFKTRVAIALVIASLWISPVVLFELFGWSVIPRWLGPILTGLLLPSIVLRQRNTTTRRLAAFLLGVLAGLLAWIASENLFGSVITLTLASVLIWSIRAVSTRAVLENRRVLVHGARINPGTHLPVHVRGPPDGPGRPALLSRQQHGVSGALQLWLGQGVGHLGLALLPDTLSPDRGGARRDLLARGRRNRSAAPAEPDPDLEPFGGGDRPADGHAFPDRHGTPSGAFDGPRRRRRAFLLRATRAIGAEPADPDTTSRRHPVDRRTGVSAAGSLPAACASGWPSIRRTSKPSEGSSPTWPPPPMPRSHDRTPSGDWVGRCDPTR